MGLELHVWKITGISPLLQNNPALTLPKSGQADELTANVKKVYVDAEEAEIRVYRNESREFVHPTAAFRSGLLVAASGRKIGKKAAKSILSGSVFPTEIEVVLLDAKGKPIKDYKIHKCRVVVNGKGVLRCRPMYSPWGLKLALDIDRDFITDLAIVTDILNIAGRIVGLGDNRPDTSKGKSGVGTFGRYSAELLN